MAISNPTAIIIASIIIGASVSAAVVGRGYFSDRYEIAATNGDAPLGWRLDKRTGAVVVCEVAKSDNPFLDAPSLMGNLPVRAVDRIMVQCGDEP